MRFSGSRGHPDFNLDGGLSKGPTSVVKAAKDPVRVPEDPEYVNVIERCFCRVALGEDKYVVTGLTGVEQDIPYGAPLSKWVEVCEHMLELALKSEHL